MHTIPPARRALATSAALLLTLSAVVAGASAADAATPGPAVTRMAALGDSITQATMTCSTLSGCPTNSWSTGTSSTVNSHLLRLRAAGATSLAASNLAVNGSTSAALPGQAQTAASSGAQYVTIEIGANDACASTVAGMTPTATFRTNVDTALATLAAGSGSPEVFVASVPNLQRMYDLNRSSFSARFTWSLLRTCQSMLANPSSTSAADVQRRAAVQQRVNEYNAELQAACAAAPRCRFDGGAVANYQFVRSDISTRDYFHPSISGQAALAAITWPRTQWVG